MDAATHFLPLFYPMGLAEEVEKLGLWHHR
jgi:hypothetical protein